MWYDNVTAKFISRVNSVSDPVVTEAAGQALTNKTITNAVSISTLGGMTIGAELSTLAGSDNTSTGTLNDVSTSATSFFRFTNSTGPTVTGLANGTNGKRLTLAYTGTGTMQINNADALSIPANRIATGTGNNLTIQSGANIELIYDSSASLWRVVGGIVGFQPLSSDVKGIVDGSNAPAGYIGEYHQVIFGPIGFSASNTWSDLASMTLAPGDWDLSCMFMGDTAGASVTSWQVAITKYPGNDGTDVVLGSTGQELSSPTAGGRSNASVYIRANLTTPTTYYAKFWGTYTGGTPQGRGKLYARRPR